MKEKIAIISILVNMALAGGKITVGLFSNSAAILAAGVDSLVDIFSSGISYLGIKIGQKPGDKKHPYGHYKFEVLAGAVITIILLLTGLGIIYDAYRNFLEPQIVNLGYLAFGVMIATTIVNEIMARLKIHYGKKENAVSLISDGFHSKVDVYTSVGVLGGLLLIRYWIYADGLIAFLMGLYIIKESISIGREALGSLLDVAADEETENQIKEIVKSQNVELSSLKTQKKGSAITANLEIKLSPDLKVEEATKISNNLKNKLIESIDTLQYVAIQIGEDYNIEAGFYKPKYGRGFGWQRQNISSKATQEASRKGPNGECVCSKCGYTRPHKRGVPCPELKCPHCDIDLKRK